MSEATGPKVRGKMMNRETKLLTGIIAGALVGAAIGVLIAPKTGKESRGIVVARTGELRKKAGGMWGNLRQFVRKEPLVSVGEYPNGHVE